MSQHQQQPSFPLGGKHRIPALGLGTYSPQESDDEIICTVRTAIHTGYRHLDCAAVYRNERAIGHAIKMVVVEDLLTREDLFVTSKLWNTCHDPDLVCLSLKKSLEDLGLAYLDLYLIHWPMGFQESGEFYPEGKDGKILYSDIDFIATWKALEDCVDEGLTRDMGLSNFTNSEDSEYGSDQTN